MLALGNGILNLEISVINVGSLLQTIVHKYSCLGEEVSGNENGVGDVGIP